LQLVENWKIDEDCAGGYDDQRRDYEPEAGAVSIDVSGNGEESDPRNVATK
jgi:hypothetical protein